MKPEKMQKIRRIWEDTIQDFPNNSIEFQLEVTAQRCNNSGLNSIDCSDVAEALNNTYEKTNPIRH